jgi:signal peptidase I
MFAIYKVSGNSMRPLYEDGDFVVVSGIPFLRNRIKAGDVIVFRSPANGIMIKMAEDIEDQRRIRVIGTCASNTDSRKFGAISFKDVLGKVILRIRKT